MAIYDPFNPTTSPSQNQNTYPGAALPYNNNNNNVNNTANNTANLANTGNITNTAVKPYEDNTDYAKLITESINSGNYNPAQINAWATARDVKLNSNPTKYVDSMSTADLLKKLNYDPNKPMPYTGQYDKQISDILNKINNTQDYNSPYAAQLQNYLNQLQNRNFVYNPATDVNFQNASKELSRNVMEGMNERGILNSTVTENQVQQGVKQLEGEFYDKAQAKFQQDTDNMYKMASFLQTLDSDAYNKYKDSTQKLYDMATFIGNLDQTNFEKYKETVDQYYKNKEFEYQKEQDSIVNKRNAINDAWARVQELGYVDNQSSITLGVPVGTPSYEAAKEKRQREYELADYEKQLKDKRQDASTDYQRQLQIMAVKNKYDKENAAADFSRQKELVQIKANLDKDNQKQVTFNDIQSQLGALKKQITTDQFETDERGLKTLKSKGVNTNSVGYFADMGRNIIPLLENNVINQKQANELAVQYTGTSYDKLVQVTNYADTAEGYQNLIDSKQLTKAQALKEIKSYSKSQKAQLGDYYYNSLLNKFK